MKPLLCLLFCAALTAGRAQGLAATETEALYNLTLKCIEGGVFAGQEVTFTNTGDGEMIKGISDAAGKVKVLLPIGASFVMKVKNFSQSNTVTIPNMPYLTMNNNLQYSKNDLAFEEKFTMTRQQQAAVDQEVAKLPDTTVYAAFERPRASAVFSSLEIVLNGLDKKPLVNETVLLSGRKNKKVFKGRTGTDGSITLLLPKGDTYELSFKYDKNYDTHEVKYLLGTTEAHLQIDYIGSVETERRMKEKEKRLKEDAIRREKERREFEAYMKREGLSALVARKKELEEYMSGKRSFGDNLILKVFERNKHWQDKLVVCDLTGSMAPYAAQLELWYKLNFAKEQNLQFVFFNDGDNKADELKKIGETGGIYYTPSKGLDSLVYKMAYVQTAGGGGDGPENNMEALIKGTAQARPFKELIMIADNYAPVKDIALLESFNVPVRIILCGVNSEIEPDYLRIAWKTKGSVHTMEEDILSIGKLLDGQEIRIKGKIYRLMKGKFIEIFKS